VNTSKRQVLDIFLDGWKLPSRFKISSELAPLQWIVKRNIRLVHLYLDDSITFEALDLLLIAGRDMLTVWWKSRDSVEIVDTYFKFKLTKANDGKRTCSSLFMIFELTVLIKIRIAMVIRHLDTM
jgi:hypothetical protein